LTDICAILDLSGQFLSAREYKAIGTFVLHLCFKSACYVILQWTWPRFYISKPPRCQTHSTVTMDVRDLGEVKKNIDSLKTYFKSFCEDESFKKWGPIMVQELEDKLLSQDAYIRGLVDPVQHNSALYQAQRLVVMLQHTPI